MGKLDFPLTFLICFQGGWCPQNPRFAKICLGINAFCTKQSEMRFYIINIKIEMANKENFRKKLFYPLFLFRFLGGPRSPEAVKKQVFCKNILNLTFYFYKISIWFTSELIPLQVWMLWTTSTVTWPSRLSSLAYTRRDQLCSRQV